MVKWAEIFSTHSNSNLLHFSVAKFLIFFFFALFFNLVEHDSFDHFFLNVPWIF